MQQLPDSRSAPQQRWSPPDVARVLAGIASTTTKAVSFSSTEARPRTDTYNCGCVASDVGWTPCHRALHVTIAEGSATAPGTLRFLRLREQFQALLQRAWETRGRSDAGFEGDIRMAYGIGIDAFAKGRDLALDRIFRGDGSLEASLVRVAGTATLRLYDAGDDANPRLVLQFASGPAGGEASTAIDLSELSLSESLRACSLDHART